MQTYHPNSPLARHPYAKTALVLQGGGALGAYQAGVYEVMLESGLSIDWVAGISIGAVNAAIIAGNPAELRAQRLREFWERITSRLSVPIPPWGDEARRVFNRYSAATTILAGQPGFFAPRFPPALTHPRGSDGATSVYDTALLRNTLLELVDFDLINRGPMRLSVGAVNISNGNQVYFDSADREIHVEHIMASGALPPGFPPVMIEGQAYWDGGLVSNTPLTYVIDTEQHQDLLVFQIDLFSARGRVPGDLFDVEQRRKEIVYSSRTRAATERANTIQTLKRAIALLYERLPPELGQDEHMRALRELGKDRCIGVVHLIYRPHGYELQSSDYEFSRASMADHWQAGRDDMHRTLRQPGWRAKPSRHSGIAVFDIGDNRTTRSIRYEID
ncbi:MAG TPA: patatin-like phospholipase family protein [Hyphomicrobium sp.]|nr:patatin-like phospholipase family protein [Hyphomicrobium sp.]